MRPRFLLLILFLPACGNLHNLHRKNQTQRREKELGKLTEASTKEASSRLGEKAVGEVAYVDEGGGYVLVRARAGLVLAPSQELQCQGSRARLKITPERKNVFVAADILSGSPQKGDAVVTVASSARPGPKPVPVAPRMLPGSNAPDNTLDMDPSSIRPEDIPKTNLDEPGGTVGSRVVDQAPADDSGNLLLEPPPPGSGGPPLLPAPRLSP